MMTIIIRFPIPPPAQAVKTCNTAEPKEKAGETPSSATPDLQDMLKHVDRIFHGLP